MQSLLCCAFPDRMVLSHALSCAHAQDNEHDTNLNQPPATHHAPGGRPVLARHARSPLRRNVTFYRTREEAERHGYRPCLRCRPNEISGPVALVQRAAGLLAQSTEEGLTLCQLAETLGATQSTLRRAFLQVTGLKPHEFVQALRLNRFKALMRAGKSITDALS